MKKFLFIIALAIALLGLVYGYRVFSFKPYCIYLHSHGSYNKTVTILYPKWYYWDGEVYIIPGKYEQTISPERNYVKIRPNSEETLNINWQPKDGRYCKIQLPRCGQDYEDHLDTTRYMMCRNCGQYDAYMDPGDSFYSPKYWSFNGYEWVRH